MQNNIPPPIDTILGDSPVSADDFLNYTIDGGDFRIFSRNLTPITGEKLHKLIRACNACMRSLPQSSNNETLIDNCIAYLPSSFGLCCPLKDMISLLGGSQIVNGKKQEHIAINVSELRIFPSD